MSQYVVNLKPLKYPFLSICNNKIQIKTHGEYTKNIMEKIEQYKGRDSIVWVLSTISRLAETHPVCLPAARIISTFLDRCQIVLSLTVSQSNCQTSADLQRAFVKIDTLSIVLSLQSASAY